MTIIDLGPVDASQVSSLSVAQIKSPGLLCPPWLIPEQQILHVRRYYIFKRTRTHLVLRRSAIILFSLSLSLTDDASSIIIMIISVFKELNKKKQLTISRPRSLINYQSAAAVALAVLKGLLSYSTHDLHMFYTIFAHDSKKSYTSFRV